MSKSRDIADSAATINYIDNVTSDVQSQINTLDTALDNISVTSGTLTKTFANGESASISLTSSVLAPVVSVTKEVPQSGVTNNSWDVNSTTENYTRLDSAYATTLDFVGYSLSNASYINSLDVSSQDPQPRGMAFNSDGTKLFFIGATNNNVNEYSLSTAYNVATGTFSQSFSVASQDTGPTGISFNTNGTKMFVCGYSNDAVYEYTLTTGFDISTASYSQSFSVALQDAAPLGLAFNSNGTKMFITGNGGDSVYEYALSTGFDVSTASFVDSFSVAAQDTTPTGISFNLDGTKMFVSGNGNDSVYEYSLSAAFDVSTASYSQTFSVAAQALFPYGLVFDPSGAKMNVSDYNSGNIFQYSTVANLQLGTGSFASADVGKTIEANSGEFVLTATDGSYVETTAPTSYDQVASGSWSMYGVVYNAVDGDLELSASVATSYNFNVASYDSLNFSVLSQSGSSEDIAISQDGTKVYFLADSGNIYQYNLSVANNISTAVYNSVTLSVSAQESDATGLTFSADGTKMYIVGRINDRVYQYTLSTAWDLSTASYASKNFSVGVEAPDPRGISISSDGTKMYIVGSTSDKVFQYTLSTPYDASTGTYASKFLNVGTQDNLPQGMAISSDGTKIFVAGDQTQIIYQYNLSTPWDLSTANYASLNVNLSGFGIQIRGVTFSSDGSKMYALLQSTDLIYQYSTATFVFPTGYQPVHTTASTDTTYWTDINSMTADQAAGDGNVYYAISTDDRTTWTVIDNTDGERDIVRNNAGTWQYNSNGTYASETWTNATTNTELAALAEAMEGSVGGYSLANASYDSASFDVSAQDTAPRGLQFSDDGTKMFIVGGSGQDINEYTLSTAFNITTATFVDAFSVAGQETAPYGLAFNTSGTKMFVVGATGDDVNEYALSTGFDVSTASFVDSFSVAAQDVAPVDVAFNTNGTKMYVVGQATEAIYEYTLSTSFDVSTASFVDSFSVAAQDSFPFALAFNLDGTNMFVLTATGFIYQYALTTGFDVSTASYVMDFSVSAQTTGAIGLSFNTTGDKMYVSDQGTKKVYQYTTASYTNQMDKTQLDAVTDPNHIALGNDLDLAIVFNMTSGSTVPSSDGVAINYDANVLNKGAVLGTDYDFDAPTQNSVRITALAANNLKVRVV